MEDKEYNIDKLNRIYSESESCDSDIFAEMRSNVLMVSGQHYKKIQTGLDRNLRSQGVSKPKRLRLVKNHTAKAISDIKDILASMTPGVLPYPANENELSDQKAAELSKDVWLDGQRKNHFEEKIEQFRNSFITLGECCAKIFFDPIKGNLKGYKQKVDEEGNPLFKDPQGNTTTQGGYIIPETGEQVSFEMVPDHDQPVFTGMPVIEKFEPYNLLRPKNSKSIREAKCLILRKMVDHEDAEAIIKSSNLSDEEKEERLEWIEGASETTYKVFDGTTGGFQDAEGQVMFREFYFRQSPEFPRGYYFITCEKGILFEGELPFGEFGEVAFPIKWTGYDLYEGSCRGFSPIKRIRPSQLEINRCSSSIAETQVVLGWDKIILQKGAKFSRGIDQPGLRVFYSTDTNARVLEGRGGDQFVRYLEMNIEELYRLVNLPENFNPVSQAFDPKAELFKKQSQKARFTEPSGRLARFLKEICESYLFFAQKYLSEDDLIKAVGKSESVNIAEFKNVDNLAYAVRLMEVTDDIDSMMFKVMELETIVQYMGKNVDQDTANAIIAQFPIINKTGALKHLTLELDNINSDIMALDRGEWREANRDDAHELFVKHLTHRIKQRDFVLLPQQVQEMFLARREQHQEFIAQIAQEQQAAQAGFIPSGGALVKTDFYVNPDPSNPDKASRAMFPTEALDWLKKKLEQQGSTQDMIQMVGMSNQGAIADIGNMLLQNQQQPGMVGPQQQMAGPNVPIIQGAM